MSGKINYNYAFLFMMLMKKELEEYLKYVKEYLSHFQKSVLRGENNSI